VATALAGVAVGCAAILNIPEPPLEPPDASSDATEPVDASADSGADAFVVDGAPSDGGCLEEPIDLQTGFDDDADLEFVGRAKSVWQLERVTPGSTISLVRDVARSPPYSLLSLVDAGEAGAEAYVGNVYGPPAIAPCDIEIDLAIWRDSNESCRAYPFKLNFMDPADSGALLAQLSLQLPFDTYSDSGPVRHATELVHERADGGASSSEGFLINDPPVGRWSTFTLRVHVGAQSTVAILQDDASTLDETVLDPTLPSSAILQFHVGVANAVPFTQCRFHLDDLRLLVP
jgi:hypothetical protein